MRRSNRVQDVVGNFLKAGALQKDLALRVMGLTKPRVLKRKLGEGFVDELEGMIRDWAKAQHTSPPHYTINAEARAIAIWLHSL